MRRFFTEAGNIGESGFFITSKEDIHHISKVLRLREGASIVASDTLSWEYEGEITSIEEDLITCRIVDKQRFSKEPEVAITLFQGIPKQGKMELIVQKTVELGVSRIVPFFSARTVVTDNGNFSKKIQRWQKVAEEAGKQCGRGKIPEIAEEIKFNKLVSILAQNKEQGPSKLFFDFTLFPYENEEDRTIKTALQQLKIGGLGDSGTLGRELSIGVIIGPEGGFSPMEAQTLKEAGAEAVSLGKTILRTETAGMAAIAMIMYELEM